MRLRWSSAVVWFGWLMLPVPLWAQEATITGTVRSQRGAPLSDARVTFEPGSRSAETDAAGRFSLAIPSDTPGRLQFAAVGHTPDGLALDPLPAGGSREIAVSLAPLHLLDAITVVTQPERPLLNTENAATGGAIEAAELQALPTDARNPLALAFTIPGVAQATGFFGDAPPLSINGANSLYTQYFLDGLDNNEGFLGGPRVEFPLGGLERLVVHANTYGAELGRSSNGVVNEVSRAGSNVWRGDLFTFWRPGTPFDADPKLAPAGVDPDGFQRVQIGGGIGGPLVRNQTFVYAAAEYSNENEDRIGSTARTRFVGTEKRETVKLFGRLDHGWSPSQTTTLRFAFSHINRAGQGTGVVTPEADITTRRVGSLTALTHRTAFRNATASNTASLQFGTFRWELPPTLGDLSRPQVTIVSPDTAIEAVVGSTNLIFDETERQVQLRDVVEMALGNGHTLKFGADVIRSWFELTGSGTNPNGAYTVFNDGNIVPTGRFVSFDDIPSDVRVLSYTVDANPQQVDLTQTAVGGFIEDRWRVSPSLTLHAGLRWDYDDITSRGASEPDLNNFQPRLSFNWYRTPTSVLRGGFGMYTGKFPYAVYSDAVQFGPDGNAVVTFAGDEAPAFLEGPTAAELQAQADALPPREVRLLFARGLEQPFSYQATLGYQFQLSDAWAVSVDGVWVETRHLPRSIDLNPITAPLGPGDVTDQPCADRVCPGDPFRGDDPAVTGYRRLTTTGSGGHARYLGLYTSVRHRLTDDWTLDANWIWSRAQNDTEDINFTAAQANCFSDDMVDAVTGAPCTSAEWADAINDRRHKLRLRSIYTVADRFRVSVIADYQTGQPVNRVAGTVDPATGALRFFDLDGSGPIYGPGFVGNHDRFPGVPRNGERLPDFFELSGGVAYLVPVGAGALELRAEVFNALNGTEWGGFANGIPGGGSRTQVGRPGDPILLRSPGRPRQVQVSARYVF